MHKTKNFVFSFGYFFHKWMEFKGCLKIQVMSLSSHLPVSHSLLENILHKYNFQKKKARGEKLDK